MTPSPSVEEGVTGWGWRNLTQAPPSTGGVPSLPALKGVTGSGMVARCLRAALRGMLDPSDPRYVPPELNMQCVMKFKEKRKGHTRSCPVPGCGFHLKLGNSVNTKDQYRCAFHAPNQPHNHSMEELYLALAEQRDGGDLARLATDLMAKEGMLGTHEHHGFRAKTELVAVEHLLSGRLALPGRGAIPLACIARELLMWLHLTDQGAFQYAADLAIMRQDRQLELTEAGWEVQKADGSRDRLVCEELHMPAVLEGPKYPTIKNIPYEGMEYICSVRSNQNWTDPTVVEYGARKVSTSQGAIMAAMYKMHDGAEGRPAAVLLIVERNPDRITALTSYDDMVEYATRTGVVERLFAGNGGAAARNLDSVPVSPRPQVLRGIPVAAKVPKPRGAAAKVERQLAVLVGQLQQQRDVAAQGGAEAVLERHAAAVQARGRRGRTRVPAAESAGTNAAAAVASAVPVFPEAFSLAEAVLNCPAAPTEVQRMAQRVMSKRSMEGSASGGGAAAPSKRARLASLASTAVDFAAWALGSLLPRRP